MAGLQGQADAGKSPYRWSVWPLPSRRIHSSVSTEWAWITLLWLLVGWHRAVSESPPQN
jgi:hypothetical protein